MDIKKELEILSLYKIFVESKYLKIETKLITMNQKLDMMR